ncbi:hypothetical protein NA57DRAFT_71486 [Rhizodiscina lignyota]|uniref:Class II aldolase/adducin N-terminal domain-containing protein n=1 Tax=Rhizodiscina lignyota TaxID=1504668 RepID=A0A9P4M980_9PEZI|nr:hypothetical protein NA57DRAFT_71486 [Rhizodiscina lignyota]
MSEGYFGKREKLYLDDLYSALISAHHILHYHSVLDAYGHVSVRNPDNPTASFWLPQNLAPALLTSGDDLIEYKIEDGEVMEKEDAEKRQHFSERYIHAEMYKKFPGVNCVIHSHCTDVLPYCVGSVPLKSMTHMTGFLGSSTPVWDISSASSNHNFLASNLTFAHSLAASFKPATSTSFIYQKMRSALPPSIGGKPPDPSQFPDHPVVLMRGHGFTTCAASVEHAVFQAIYTREAAIVQSTALHNQAAWALELDGAGMEGKVDVEGGGKIKSGKVGGDVGKKLKFLSEKEAGDAWEAMGKAVGRAWKLWVREVEVAPLYRNEVVKQEEEA